MNQQGDVLLQQTVDDGEINVVDGIVEMTGDFRTAAYISLFGGNEDDDGRADNPLTWWGNLLETQPERKYVSETENLLRSMPLNSANLLRAEDAAKRDLNWFLELNIASELEVAATIPGLNKINLEITITALGEETTFNFTENWLSTQ